MNKELSRDYYNAIMNIIRDGQLEAKKAIYRAVNEFLEKGETCTQD